MNCKKLLVLALVCFSVNAHAWGKKGHRIVGEIAQLNLTPQAKKGVSALLNGESLSRVATWADEIKSNRSYDYASPWHYVNYPFDKQYFDQKRDSHGDVLEALYRMEETLKSKTSTQTQKQEALKFLVHFMGDLHQPMHVGSADDRGGNLTKVEFLGKDTNLHHLWDDGLLELEDLSYSEYVAYLNKFTPAELKTLSSGNFLDWAVETRSYRSIVYDLGENNKIGYEYHDKVKGVMENSLKRGGLRLARIINGVFANEKLTADYVSLRDQVYKNL